MNAKSFLGGIIFGAVIVLTIAAKNIQTQTWEYTVVTTSIYNDWDGYYAKALNNAAVDGWEVVTSERRVSPEPNRTAVEIVLKRVKK